MNKFFTLLVLGTMATTAYAQTTPAVQPYGKVDKADLELTACDFEKDANAESLFEKGNLYYDGSLRVITMEVHKRIKIFNDNGKRQADIHIPFYGGNNYEYITGIQAETINMVDGKPEITKLDKKQIFTKTIDRERSEITFTFPNVKPGSIVEYKYNWNTNNSFNMPVWYFQWDIPIRYSELATSIPDLFTFRTQTRLLQDYVKNTSTSEGRTFVLDYRDYQGHPHTSSYPYNAENNVRAMANIPSLPYEPYMSSFWDNLQVLRFQFVSLKPMGGFERKYSDTWAKVGHELSDYDDFGGQLNRNLANEDVIISKAKTLKTDDDKIAYVFNEVKNTMTWNDIDRWYTIDGTHKAWENKTGNSAEINLILYHLLKKSGVHAYPMVVSTRSHGKVIPYYTSLSQFNRAVVYIPVDSTKQYILDATGKYNTYNEIPAELLNSSGLYIDKSEDIFKTLFIEKNEPARQVILINGEIKPGGKLEGTAEISSTSYNRINAVERYKKDGEKKYIDYIRDDDNGLSIASVKFENMDIDTLPLNQKMDFHLDLAGSDENYIYLNPNLFTKLKKNPFLSEKRMTDIDFGYLRTYTISGIYKLPAGYKIDALPNDVVMVMPDKSASFKRMLIEEDGSLIIRYSINYSKSLYFKEDYPDFYEFYKKMNELLNEQIVLKKT